MTIKRTPHAETLIDTYKELLGWRSKQAHPAEVPCKLGLDSHNIHVQATREMNTQTQCDAPRTSWFLCLLLALLASKAAWAASPWEQPAGQLAEQVAALLGPGPAQLVVNNRSTLTPADVTGIRRLMEQDLRAHGIESSTADSANLIRVTLSENVRERLWVAEVVEGDRTHVVMAHLDRGSPIALLADASLILEKKRVWSSLDASAPANHAPVLAALETQAGLIVLEQEEIVILSKTATGWHEEKRFSLDVNNEARRSSSRDSHGLLTLASDGSGFNAFTAGTECIGTYAPTTVSNEPYGAWSVHCRASDDPWPVIGEPVVAGSDTVGPVAVKAFYNAARNYFTGIITPGLGVDLMPFYTLAALPHSTPIAGSSDQPAILVNSIEGKMLLAEGGRLKAVSGTRDWGSDFAAIHTGCGPGTQIVASGSGEAINDSLRAYDLPAQEAVAVSAPLEMGGTVTSIWTAPNGTSVWAVVHKSNNEYEVDRVTALCP